MSRDQSPDYAAMAARLDRLRPVPDEVLALVLLRGGLCLQGLWPPQEPDWDAVAPDDRALAARLCAGCPVIDPCLELDLRTEGARTAGVWGALPEDDRRALHPVWLRHREQGGGTQP